MVLLLGLPLHNMVLPHLNRIDVRKLDIPANSRQKNICAGDETKTNFRKLTVAQPFERHRPREQRGESRLGNQEKSHEDVSLSHMTSGIQWQAMEAHKKGLLLSCKLYPHRKEEFRLQLFSAHDNETPSCHEEKNQKASSSPRLSISKKQKKCWRDCTLILLFSPLSFKFEANTNSYLLWIWCWKKRGKLFWLRWLLCCFWELLIPLEKTSLCVDSNSSGWIWI